MIDKNLEIKLASEYINSVNAKEPIAEQERKYWMFRNYSVENEGDRELRVEIYDIHTREFNKQLGLMK